MTDRERDIMKSRKAATQSKHKDRTLTAESESWEKAKMTRRHSGTKLDISVIAVANRMSDGDRDYKQGIQQRPSENHGFRSNIRNENYGANPTKVKGSHAFAKSSQDVSHTSSTFDNREQSLNSNSGQITGGSNSCKRPFLTELSSAPVTDWSEQKPRKHQRTKRKNLMPQILNHDDLPNLVEGSSISDSPESSGQGILRCSSNNSAFQQSRLKTGTISSLAALSESKESGFGDKCKNKMKKQGDAVGKIVPVHQKVGSLVLPLIKAKIVTKKEIGDGVHWPGRSGRDNTPLRMNAPISGKLENLPTTTQLRSTRLDTDKVASKTGQSPTGKTSLDQKAVTRPRCPIKNGLSSFTGMLLLLFEN